MNRYHLTRSASEDLAAIRSYLNQAPDRYTAPIRRGLRALLQEIAAHPERGQTHSQASRLLGEPVQTRVLPPYRIFYREVRGIAEILGILHTAQDIDTILAQRLQ